MRHLKRTPLSVLNLLQADVASVAAGKVHPEC